MAYNTIDEIKTNIVEEISTELAVLGETDISDALISLKVDDAVREAEQELRIPVSYSDAQILSAMNKVYMNIKAKAFCKINRIGFEYQSASTENGISRTFVEYEKLSKGIVPIARVI